MRPSRLLALLLVAGLLLPEIGSAANPDKGPFKYLSPLPGADWISARTSLIFRAGDGHRGEWMGDVSVVGSESGRRPGRWIAASDGETFIFDPDGEFVAGERVHVVVGRGFRYGFTIAPEVLREESHALDECLIGPDRARTKGDRPDRPVTAPRRSAAGYQLPDFFPEISILVNERTSPGSLFLTGFRFSDLNAPGETRYLTILDNDGEPVFFRAVQGSSAADFKVQPDGRLSYFSVTAGAYYLMDDTYTVVDSVRSQNYGHTDSHDLQVLPNGNFLIIGQQSIPYDMSQIVEGGDPRAWVVNMIIQELDGDDNVVFEWRSWDHFSPLDAIGYDLTVDRVDYVHTNSVELDHDGGIIMSHRHLDEVTKVSRDTGEIVWHMGGKHNDFTLVNDDHWFSHQHSARRQPGGTLTLFDNGNNSESQESRAVEYEIDEVNMTVTRVWSFKNDPPQVGWAMGNVQRQPGGNTVIGWGSSRPNMTEVRPDGSKVFEMEFGPGMYSYRAFRFKWKGVAARPDVWAATNDHTLTINFTRFGDKNVARYNVYGGDYPHPTQLVRTTEGNCMVVRGTQLGQTLFFRVTAVDHKGNESPFSNEIAVVPELWDPVVEAGLRVTPKTFNLARQGRWINASVDFGEACGFSASDGVEDILLNGVVGPDRVTVRSDGDDMRGLDLKFPSEEVVASLAGGPAEITVTGRVGDIGFTASSVVRVIGPTLSEDARDSVEGTTSLRAIRPNPFNPSTVVHYSVATQGQRVTIEVFDVTGRRVQTLVDGPVPAGDASVAWNGRDYAGRPLATGVYFCRMQTGATSQTLKMLLVK